MNCPSRTDEPEGSGMNQNPNALSADLTTREDLNGMANTRALKRSTSELEQLPVPELDSKNKGGLSGLVASGAVEGVERPIDVVGGAAGETSSGGHNRREDVDKMLGSFRDVLKKFGKFCGPGMMISVAYIDPGNYATDVAAGASYRYRLLFIVFMSNVFAVFLQNLCIKLGTVSGLNLAEACKEFLPRWLNIFLYLLAEAAIIATDIAEVIGTAIAINLLIPKIPLVAGCALSILDVLLILLFYNPQGSMRGLRCFEIFVAALVLGVVICFCIQLSLITDTSVGEVFKGYLPSGAIAEKNGLYQACGILGATVMPHSLYLGSGIVQPRLREYDEANGHFSPSPEASDEKEQYFPSLPAIKHCLNYSMAELTLCLLTFALFVNSAILITAGASLYGSNNGEDADLFQIYDLLSGSIGKGAGTIFALALLLSGISAGIVCTIAGQMVSEGALNWKCKPWLRRAITRSISITPSIIIAGAVGRPGLSAALNGSQVALSIALPFVSAPLIYFTSRNKYMTVKPHGNIDHDDDLVTSRSNENENEVDDTGVKMKNHWITVVFGVLVWLLIAILNVANLVLLGKGQ